MEFFSKILGRTDAENNTFDSENNRSLKSPHSKLDISSEKLEVPVKDSENVLNVSDLARDLSDKLILGTPRQEASTKFNTNKWASPCRSANNSLLSDSGNNSLLSTSGTFSPSSDASFVTARDSSLTSNVCNSPGGDDIETIVLDKTIDLSSDSADSFNLTLDASIIPKAEPRSNKKSEGDDFEIVDIDCDKEDVKGKPTQQHSQESSEATESSEANDYIDSSVVSQDISYLSAEESISEEGTSRYASLENVYNTVIHYSQVDDYEVSVVGLNDITRASERGPNDNTRATEVSVLGLNDITRADYTVETLSTTNVPDESNVDQFIEEISVVESVNKTALVDGKEQLLETSIQVEDSESLNSSSRTLNESIVNISTTSTNTESPELDEPIEVEIVSNDHENNFEQLEKHISEINLNSELSVEEIRAANLSKSLTVVSEPDPTGEAKPDSNEQELVTKSIVESTQDASETFENLERSKADTVVSAETKPIEAIKEDSIVVPPEAALNPVTVDSKQEKQQESEVSENQIEPVVESEESSAEKVIETSSVEKLANETEVLSSDIKEKESIPSDQPAQSNSNSTEYQCEPLNLSIDNLKESNQESFEQSPVEELTETSAENESAVIVSKELTDPSLEKPSEQIAAATENQEPIESTVGDLNNTNETLNPVAEEEGLPNRDEKDLSTEETNFVAVTEEVTVQESDHKIVEESVQVDHPEKSSIQEVVQLKEVEISQVAEDRQETKPFEVQEENSEPKLQAFEVEKTEESVKTDLENPESKVEATVVEKVEKSENLPVEVEKTDATDLEKPVFNSGEPTVDSGNLVIKQTVQQSESLPVVVEKTVETVQDDVQEVKQSKKEETVPIVSEEEKKISDIPPVPEPLTENKEVEPKELSAIEPQEILETTKTALESNINTASTLLVSENHNLEKHIVEKSNEEVTKSADTQEIKVQEQVSEPEVPAPVIENVEKTNPDTVEVQEPIKTDLDKPEPAVEHQIKPTNTEETKSSEAKEQLSEPEVKESVVEKKEVAETVSTGLDKPKPKVEEQVTEPEVQVSVVEKTQTVSFEVENPAKLTNPVTDKKTEITPLEVKKTNTAEQVKPTEQEAIVQVKAAETTEQESIVQTKAAEITVQEAKDQVKAAEIGEQKICSSRK
uniref:Uncharacterized protein n=1 Tax=Cacopsylla melanoneura TaxID=428564 RepID=A0A8D8U9K9_9HEMI